MGCIKCGFTGIVYEYDETAGPGDVAVVCPECVGVDGEQPDWVTEAQDVPIDQEKEE